VSSRFGEQKEGRGGQDLFQILHSNVQRNWRVKDSGMSNDSEELVKGRPGNRPGRCSLRQPVEDVERGNVALARFDFGMNEDVRVNRLHGLAPVHEIEQGVTVQQINPRLFRRLPAPKSQAVRFSWAGRQRTAKKVVSHRLQGPALFGGLFLQLAEELIVNRQGGSLHMQKHTGPASRCQLPLATDRWPLARWGGTQ